MKKIGIIGASYLQLPLVKKAKEMGIETHCFAWEEGAVCKDIADYFYPVSILEKEQILEICKEIQIDGITTIASDAAVPTVCYVAQSMGLITNEYETSQVATNKYLMRRCFSDNGVNSPKFSIVDEKFSDETFRYPLIVKPTDRSGSRGVMKVEEKSDLIGAIQRAQQESFTKQAIVEEYVSGSEVSVESISWEGNHFILAITDKITTGEPYFVELEHHQPSQLSQDIQEKIETETRKALTALRINYGASHAEFKITESGEVFVIEVGARMGGDFIGSDLVKLSTGYDFLEGVINVALGYFRKPVLSEKKYSGVYFLSKETEYIKPLIENKDKYAAIISSEITDEHIHMIESSSDRSGYFIYQSETKMELGKI